MRENNTKENRIKDNLPGKLNLALTFYGGVSLAVYEAGVAEEFVRFIQYYKDDDTTKPIGACDIDLKVISGASAGGLAAV